MTSTSPVQRPLTALVPLKAADAGAIRELAATPGALSDKGLDEVGTVHFARIFVMPEDNAAGLPANIAAVITSYDGDFAAYIQDFVNNDAVAAIFDELLKAADDPEAGGLVPVQKNAAAFAAWVKRYDVTFTEDTGAPKWGFWYSAYPDKTVQNVLAH